MNPRMTEPVFPDRSFLIDTMLLELGFMAKTDSGTLKN